MELITGVNKIMEFGDKRRGMGIPPGIEIQLLCDLKLIVGCENTCFHRWGCFVLHFIADIGRCHKREDKSIL